MTRRAKPRRRATGRKTVKSRSRQFWVGVVSREHVLGAVAGGFAQLGHGKSAPLKRMRAGDGLVYYSPRLSYPDGAPCQRFTAIGIVETGEVYQRDMGAGFVPYRIDVAYQRCREAPIQPLIPRLSFIKDKTRWGGAFRFGHLRVSPRDFALIAKHMGCDPGTLLRPKPPA
jgi:EVE domain